jgi:hypothetical protein
MKKIKLGLASLATFESIKPPHNLRKSKFRFGIA